MKASETQFAMKGCARRDPQYQVKLLNEKANKDNALLQGIQRGSVQATNTAKTRSRHLNQELTMIRFFLRAGEAMRSEGGGEKQDIYEAWVDCAQQLMRPLGKVNPSNRAGSPLYDDLHVMLQNMIDRGVISAVDDVPDLPPFYCTQPMPGLVGPLHPTYTFASVASTTENFFE